MSNEANIHRPKGVELGIDRLVAQDTGTSERPAIAIGGEKSNNGFYINAKGEMVFTRNGKDDVVYGNNHTTFKSGLRVSGSEMPEIKCGKDGIIYKKLDHSGLWWRTKDMEIDLTNGNGVADLQRLPPGLESSPSVSFEDKTGFYRPEPGILAVVVSGKEVARFTSNGLNQNHSALNSDEMELPAIDEELEQNNKLAELPDMSDYAKKSDLESYAKQSELESYAKKSDIPQQAEFPNLSEFAKKSDIPQQAEFPDLSEYAKKSDLPQQAEFPDLTEYAKKSDIPVIQLPDLSEYAKKSDIPVIQLPDLSEYAKKSDIPVIQLPDLTEYAKKSDIPQIELPDLSEYAKKSDIPRIELPDLTEYAKKSDIPLIDLTEFAKKSDLPQQAEFPDLSEYAKKSDIPQIELPDLTEYAKKSDIPQIELPDLTEYAKKSDMPLIDLTEFAKKSDIPLIDLSHLAEKSELESYAKKSDIPLIDLTEFAKKSDIPQIELPDLSEYAKKSDIPQIELPDLTEFAKKSDIPQIELPDLTEYAKKSDIPQQAELPDLSNFVDRLELKEFAEKSDLSGYVEKSDLSGYVEKSELSGYVEKSELSGYVEKSELASYVLTETLNQKLNEVLILPTNNSAVQPLIKFKTDMDTGISHAGDGSVGIVSNGQLKQVIGEQIIYYDTIAIKDTSASAPSEPTEGHLYKKPNNPGLFWSTTLGEVNLARDSNAESIAQVEQKIIDLIPALNAKAETCIIDAEIADLKTKNEMTIAEIADLKTKNDDLAVKNTELAEQLNQTREKVQRLETLTAAVELQAGSEIKFGDVICMTSTGAHKSIGYYEELQDDSQYNFIAQSTNTVLRLQNQIIVISNQQTNILGTIPAENKIALVISDQKTCIAELSSSGQICIIHIWKHMNQSYTRLEVPLQESYNNLAAGLSDITQVGIIVLVGESGDFLVLMVDLETDSIGSTDNHIMIGENSIAHSVIHESEKHMSLCVIPGGTCVLAYGRLKIPFLVATADGMITTGEPYVDFQNDDCLGIIYDEHIGYFISLEKSQGGAFIQAMDTIGTTLQKLSSTRLSNVDNPLGLAKYLDHYTVVYQDADLMALDIRFDGNFTVGMRSRISGNNFVGLVHNKSYYLVVTNKLNKLLDDYHGRPSDYIGLARSNAQPNQDVAVQIRGTMFDSNVDLPLSWIGKKMYLSQPSLDFPNNLSLSYGIPIGTCVSQRRILVGL